MNILNNRFFQHSIFQLRFKFSAKFVSSLRGIKYKILGMEIGSGTYLPSVDVSWPHQISIGTNCRLESNIYFKYDGIWSKGPSIKIGSRVFIGKGCEFNITRGIQVGSECLIASGCKFIDHNHGTSSDQIIRLQKSSHKPIVIGEGVWLGCNVIVLEGVEIGDGAIVAAGAVVQKSIPSKEIWGGVPARKIGERKNISTEKAFS